MIDWSNLHADALLKAMSVALDCETVCVSLLTSTRTIISNGTGLMRPRMSFPTGVCHWSLVPQDAQTIIVEDMLEDERWLLCPLSRDQYTWPGPSSARLCCMLMEAHCLSP